MQRLDIVHPGEGHLIIGPAAGYQDGDFVVARPVERPVVKCGEPLDHIEGAAGFSRDIDERHAVSTLRFAERSARAPGAAETKPRRITCPCDYTPAESGSKKFPRGISILFKRFARRAQ